MNLKPIIKHLLKKILTLKTMKTSNKLLIALAISLILIPIIVVAITVKMNYKTEKSIAVTRNTEKFSAPAEGYISTEISQSIKEIIIDDAKDFFLTIRIVKDIKSGVKIPEEYKDLLSFKVDDKGVLRFSLKMAKDEMNPSARIIIYSPTVNLFSCTNGRGVYIRGNQDSLTLNTKAMHFLTIDSESTLNNLVVSADDIKEFLLNKAAVNNTEIKLKSSNFKTEAASFRSLKINATGTSNIEIDGDESKKDKYLIDDLSIKTEGKSNIDLTNIKVNKASGSLSDSTKVNMPVYVLKTMFKN